jgi:DNA-directed RNA polymerase subunit beta'
LEVKNFNALRISLASPEEIRSWSYGEVTKPETINYRRLRPEKDGLFCEIIFGPTKDWQCYCGKYKQMRYKGITCERCGVLVTRSSVRRERMGHIVLAAPIAHIWYTRRVPSYLGLLLDISRRNLDRVLYFAQYIITKVDEAARAKALRRLDEELKRERARLEQAAQERIAAAQARAAQQIARWREAEDSARQRLEEQQAPAIEQVMREAQLVQSKLEDRQAVKVRVPILFSGSARPIVEKGETIAAEHLTRLNTEVQARLSAIEAHNKEQLAGERERIGLKIERLRHEADQETSRLEDELAQGLEKLSATIEEQRRELLSLAVMQFPTEAQYYELRSRWGNIFKAGMGAEALHEICKNLDLDALARQLRAQARSTRSKQVRKKAIKRLRVVEALRKSGNRPEWMILTVLPVIPPDLRPVVQLDGGRFATSDLNDLYRRVINRNNRLRRLLELGAPDVIVRNEKRMLQEAVDSLIDNSRRGKAISTRGHRQLKSLSDMLKGKQGRFRRNLLGKRVDYSGRSVIVIGPDLELHQCGLPKGMALELFRPFVIHKLVEQNYASNVKGAKRILEQGRPEVWEVLEEVIKSRPILLNRAPTLHRLGIQAFEPVMVEGNAIQIHPLVCAAFNADFDGDQMAVHIPLSRQAVEEARQLMLSTRNLLKPASGEPIIGPTKDMVLGCYYLTMARDGCLGEGKIFSDLDEVALAYALGKADLHAQIKVLQVKERDSRRKHPVETTVGRALFNQVLPDALRYVNEVLDKNVLRELVARAHQKLGPENTVNLVDQIKALGFKYATLSGTTIAVSDITVPEAKTRILNEVVRQVNSVEQQYRRGLITEEEQYVRTVELWTKATDEITEAVAENLDLGNPIFLMARSGATKGGFQPIRQLAGMRGLMADPSGRIISMPVRSNFREGLTALEYFISTHGARKGLADTALRTADAGYLTRRLVDVAQDAIINAEDCGTSAGIWINRADSDGIGESFDERILGRVAAAPIVDPSGGQQLVAQGELIGEDEMKALAKAGVESVYVRSPMTCQLRRGICALCYGRDLARGGGLVQVGEAVGVIAAQSIGEPGTQLTLRTFHTGGVATDTDITHGLPRVQELFEARVPKGEAIIADIDGVVHLITNPDGTRLLKVVHTEVLTDEYPRLRGGYKTLVEDGEEIAAGTVLQRFSQKGIEKEVVAEREGRVELGDDRILVHRDKREEVEYEIASTARPRPGVEDGKQVRAGQQLTEGSKNPHHIMRIMGWQQVQMYLLEEVQKVYRSQGVSIHDKHIELIIRQMVNKVWVVSPGDTDYLPGELVDRLAFAEVNDAIAAQGKRPATGRPVLLGITKAALNTDSFLSASSFQHTINVLASAAIEGRRDDLRGLKENVIIGKLIPAGTGFRYRRERDGDGSRMGGDLAEMAADDDGYLPEMAVGDDGDLLDGVLMGSGTLRPTEERLFLE